MNAFVKFLVLLNESIQKLFEFVSLLQLAIGLCRLK